MVDLVDEGRGKVRVDQASVLCSNSYFLADYQRVKKFADPFWYHVVRLEHHSRSRFGFSFCGTILKPRTMTSDSIISVMFACRPGGSFTKCITDFGQTWSAHLLTSSFQLSIVRSRVDGWLFSLRV